jgi:hypothetical protein
MRAYGKGAALWTWQKRAAAVIRERPGPADAKRRSMGVAGDTGRKSVCEPNGKRGGGAAGICNEVVE